MQSTTNQRTQTHPPVPIYFKESFTTNTKIYYVYPDWTLYQFESALKPLIAIDFAIETAFVLVLMGQPCGENGDPIPQLDGINLADLWEPELNIGFYIRRQ
jgi:hypothetical protein